MIPREQLLELTSEEMAAMNSADMTPILGTLQERYRHAMDFGVRMFRERNEARDATRKCPFCKEPAIRMSQASTTYRCGTSGPDDDGNYDVGHTCDILVWTRLLNEKDSVIAELKAELDRLKGGGVDDA